MNETVVKGQSGFSRVLYNEAKMGDYRTDRSNCERISQLLDCTADEIACLEPSIADGVAVSIVTGKAQGNNVKVFGVELNAERYELCKINPHIDYHIRGDFLQDVNISNHKFSLCFMNPPYGKSMVGERYEKLFLKKVDNYLMVGGILVMIIPYYIILEDEGIAKILTNRFNVATILKFTEPEFSRFKQVALIAIKKQSNTPNPDAAKEIIDYLSDIDNVFELPEFCDKKLKVPSSYAEDITVFEGKGIDMNLIQSLPQNSKLFDLLKHKTMVKRTGVDQLGNPPTIPNRDHSFLLVVSGFGEGKMGSLETKDYHLQRGRVISDKDTRIEEGEDGKVRKFERQYHKTEMVIVENSGKITVLK